MMVRKIISRLYETLLGRWLRKSGVRVKRQAPKKPLLLIVSNGKPKKLLVLRDGGSNLRGERVIHADKILMTPNMRRYMLELARKSLPKSPILTSGDMN